MVNEESRELVEYMGVVAIFKTKLRNCLTTSGLRMEANEEASEDEWTKVKWSGADKGGLWQVSTPANEQLHEVVISHCLRSEPFQHRVKNPRLV